ncbi:hypothetical protein [Amycolatopsis sp. 3B14]|uniref:hypothetical protein n=1 Tax=Amycolatopsis sp. 3B14 TaxID=3243600 RepID=UPI003D959C48
MSVPVWTLLYVPADRVLEELGFPSSVVARMRGGGRGMSAPALSLLYVPADWPVRVAKGLDSAAEVVLVELGFPLSVVARLREGGAV